nr:cellulase N-terminal Ig-like domain-containing protein [Micromonospora cremea]
MPSRPRLPLAAATTLALTGAGAGAAHADPPPDAPEQIDNGDFSAGVSPWFSYGTGALEVTDGRLCTTVPGGLANPWDAGIGQDGVPLVAGAQYTLGFAVSATPGAAIKAVLQLGSAPYTTYAAVDATATGTAQRVEQTFTVPDDNPGAQLIIQVGGAAETQTVCLDDVSRRGGEPPEPYEPDTGPRVRVNQVGYLPGGPKNATVVTEATEPLPWQLRSAGGTVLVSGTTTARGVDAASGQNLHTVDFSSYRTPGSRLTLTVGGETSHPFDISGALYDRLRADSLQFFYAQRSGIAIDGDLIGDEYARPAGHLGVAPNQGDTNVPCQPGVCDYSLDVRGG